MHLRVAHILLAACLLTGCPNPNLYGTPRTTPKGEVAHTVGLEAYAAQVPSDLDDDDQTTWVIPTIPSYTLRLGVAERTDLGFRVSSLSLLGFDAKLNFLRDDAIDLAIDPGVQYLPPVLVDNDFSVVYGHLPLLMGLNVAESTTIVLSGGYLGWYLHDDDPEDSDTIHLARGGLGLEVRPSEGFAIQPEVTAMTDLDETLVLVGLGLTFGALPLRNGAP